MAILGGVALGLAFPAAVWLPNLWAPEQWLAVPGGIVVRASRWWQPHWQVTLFKRESGTLVYWREGLELAVADAGGIAFARYATVGQAELAIRAWLSPLPPPPLERLSDLAG